MLKISVDLIWFGGIGTFVKASNELNRDANNSANNNIRIDAKELRCKVIGEGANLGLTQKARVEFALRNGRVNNDAIDNVGGISCSDHEINIKIILNRAILENRISQEERNQLLEKMSPAVVDLVLRENYQQTQAITLSEKQSVDSLDRHIRLIQVLEKGERGGKLDCLVEQLPDNESLI